MITATTLPIFPGCPSYGFSSQPDYLVSIIAREGGHERRDRKWLEPLHRYEGAPMGPRPQADIEAIANFWHAIGGNHLRFLFKDWADYRSARLDDPLTTADQPFIDTGNSPGGFQLVKVYSVGALETVRTIRHPKGDTIIVQNTLGDPQDPSTWTIDEDTGLLVPNGSFTGTPGGWGGEFYVPVRFDGPLRVEIVDRKIESLGVSLQELRSEE